VLKRKTKPARKKFLVFKKKKKKEKRNNYQITPLIVELIIDN